MGLLWQLDHEGALVGEWAIGPSPSELVVHGGTVWIGNQDTTEVLRIPVTASTPVG